MPASDEPSTIHSCGSCGNLGIGDGPIRCCDQPMRPANTEASAVPEPTLEDLLGAVFQMSESELDICLCVMEGGGLTVKELAAETDYDRSSVARHLSHLVDLGVLEKRRQLLEQGGHVYVYTPTDPDMVRQSFRDTFHWWIGAALARIDELSREKVEAIVETTDEDAQWRIYKQ